MQEDRECTGGNDFYKRDGLDCQENVESIIQELAIGEASKNSLRKTKGQQLSANHQFR